MANIKQIAQMAGVSVTTVSRVLNAHPYVKEDKRAAVMEAVEKLNYSQNMNAVHLVRGKTMMIAVILPYVNHPCFANMMDGVANAALACNYKLLLCQTDYRADEELRVLELLKMKQIDGVIICSKTMSWEEIEPYSAYGPVIACENAGERNISSVYVDHYGSFKLGMDYLISKGHRRIGYFIGRGDSHNNLNRKRAFEDALHAVGEVPRDEWRFERVFTFERGVEVMRQLLTMEERPTALIGAGDEPAAAIIAEARKHGLRVPEDLAVIGSDNQPIAEVMGVTTIELALRDVGRIAVELLYERMNDKTLPPTKRQLDYRLIERLTV